MNARSHPLVLAAALLAATLSVSAASWPQYRGPNASGLDASAPLPTTWNIATGENIRWQTPIPGLAHASPIVSGERIYVTTAISAAGAVDLKVGLYGDIGAAKDHASHQWRLLALDRATGKILWNRLGHEGVPKSVRHTKATHCNSTPATDGTRIVAIFGSEGLFCFDATDGRLLWKKDLGPMDAGYFKMPSAQWGYAASPIIHEGKVIVQCDVQQGSSLAVFDLADGREVWRTARTDVPTWSTPAIVIAGGRTQIAVNGWHHAGGYDFATGRELWKLDGGGDIPVPTPLAAGDLIYFTSAHGRSAPMRAIRADARGDITPANADWKHPSIAWNHDRRGNYLQTPILVGRLLYGCRDNATLTCFDAITGEVRYSERLTANASEGVTASPVSDGRHLFFTSELGNVFVVPATDQFSLAGKNALDETCLATPAIAAGTLFFSHPRPTHRHRRPPLTRPAAGKKPAAGLRKNWTPPCTFGQGLSVFADSAGPVCPQPPLSSPSPCCFTPTAGPFASSRASPFSPEFALAVWPPPTRRPPPCRPSRSRPNSASTASASKIPPLSSTNTSSSSTAWRNSRTWPASRPTSARATVTPAASATSSPCAASPTRSSSPRPPSDS